MENLKFKKYGSGEPVIILHGLFGMLDNWKTFGEMLAENYAVYLIDQRNHGNSPHKASHTYEDMAGDLSDWMEAQDIQNADIIGHSMGGKTALTFALSYPEKTRSVISIDMGIKEYPPGHDIYFEAMLNLPINKIDSRAEADTHLRKLVPNDSLRLFLMKSIHRNKNGTYEWKLNLQQLYNDYDEILKAITSENQYTGKTLFIGGTESGYVSPEDLSTIRELFPTAEIVMINAGHWIHAEEPEELHHTVKKFLASV